MKARVITLLDNDYSVRSAERCQDSANIPVEEFMAVTPNEAVGYMEDYGLKWTWGTGYKGMTHKPYGGDHWSRVACFLSHYLLWTQCARSDSDYLILEHDAVFVRDFKPFRFKGICMINDPRGATPRGKYWAHLMEQNGPGVHKKTRIFDDARPDGLAGGSAYLIKPKAARKLIKLVDKVGAWPNDAIICRQLVPNLQEHYPFITEVRDSQSTIRKTNV